MRVRGNSLLAGFGWSGMGEVAKILIQFIAIVILTRFLPPADFGVVALATVFTAFAGLIQDFGTSTALVQRKVVNQALISTIFWLNIAIGMLLCLAMIGLAPAAAFLLQEERLADVLVVLALVFPLSTAGAMQRAMLQRAGKFATLARQEVISGLCSLAAAVAAAIAGWGVYSLVVQQLVAAGMSTLQSWFTSPAQPGWQWSGAEFRETWSFTSHLLAFRCITYFARNSDNILIGRFLGPTDLAWYSMAYRVLLVPIQSLGRIMNRVLLPYYSRCQEDPRKVGEHFLVMMSILGLAFGPAFALIWAIRTPFVEVFFGPEWSRMADVLAWLAPVGIIQAISNNVGLLLSAMGNTRQLRNIGFLSMVGFVIAFCVGLPFGVTGVAAAYFVANLLLARYALDMALRIAGQDFWKLCRVLWRQVLISICIGAAVRCADLYALEDFSSLPRLFLLSAGGFALYLMLVAAIARDVVRSVWRLRKEVGGQAEAVPLPQSGGAAEGAA